VDFSLTNAELSGLGEVLLLSHHNEPQLIRYLLRAWKKPGRFRIHFGPHDEALRHGEDPTSLSSRPIERGTAEALLTNAEHIFDSEHREVLVLHADHVYRFQYQTMLAHHRASGAALTMGYQEIDRKYVRLFGMVEFDEHGWLKQFVEKPTEPTTNLVFSAFCLFNRVVLARYLDELQRTDWGHDISRDVIPAMLANGERIGGFHVDGYWEDIGTVDRYHRAHMALLDSTPSLSLTELPRTVLPHIDRRLVAEAAGISHSIVPDNLLNAGRLERSVAFPGVRIGAGAVVRDCVLLAAANVPDGAEIESAIVFEDGFVQTAGRTPPLKVPGPPAKKEASHGI
jgi:glucose-1-phosphate adenylyltransferase